MKCKVSKPKLTSKEQRLDSDTMEICQIILNFFEHLWKIPVHLHLTDDIHLFNKYCTKYNKATKNDWAGSDVTTGLIYVDPARHNKNSRVQLFNSLLHEALHCKYPRETEKQILKLSNNLIGVQS
jgi:hypothetical protein